MTIQFKVKGDIKRMTRDLNKVQRKIVPKVTSQAMNKTLAKMRTQWVREMAARLGIQQKLLRQQSIMFRTNPFKLRASLLGLVAGIRISRFSGTARETGTGAKKGKRFFEGGFIATMPSGHTSIFQRKGRPRLPIKEPVVSLQPEGERLLKRIGDTTGIKFFLAEFQRLLSIRLKRR